jgi:hypothetical protein
LLDLQKSDDRGLGPHLHERCGFVEAEMKMAAARKMLALVVAAVGLASSDVWAFGTNERVEVPIRQVTLSNGVIRYSVPVSIGGTAPIEAMLDTGSFGLRVLKGALLSSRYEPTEIQRNYPFGSGVRRRGIIARAVVSIGTASTGAPIPIHVVQSVDCVESKPNCPASKLRPVDYRIGGDGFPREGFEAILGLSMRSPQVQMGALNPLSSIGSRSWIVVLPRPGEASSGQLIVNPSPAEQAGFTLFRMKRQPTHAGGEEDGAGWMDTTIPACVGPADATQVACSSTRIDTGGSMATIRPFWSHSLLFEQNEGIIGIKARQ